MTKMGSPRRRAEGGHGHEHSIKEHSMASIAQKEATSQVANPLQIVVDKLPAGTKTLWSEDGTSVNVQCPAHDDQNPSLTISPGNDQPVTLHCHAGCTPDAILAKLGLTWADVCKPLEPKSKRKRIMAAYDYYDLAGEVVYQVVRYEPKTFRQRRPDGKGGWVWNMNGVTRILYRLPAITAADPEQWVFICEGEKSALDVVNKLKLEATTNVGGAGKWLSSYNETLRGRKVAILPDNDRPGGEHATKIWQVLKDVAADVRVVKLPGLALQEDVSDWIARGGTIAALLELVKEAPSQVKQKIHRKIEWTADELLAHQFPELNWVIPGILPEGLALLAGRPKLGKSWLAMQWALSVGTGGVAFDRQVERGKVLYIALEDSPRRLQSRQKIQNWPSGADVTFVTVWPDMLDGGLQELQARLEAEPHRLIVIDTLSRIAHFDQNEVEKATAVLSPLQHLALDHRCGILVNDHHNKLAHTVDDVIDAVLGSTGKAAVADTIMGLFRDRGKQGATLKITGRDVEDTELVIQWDGLTCSWQLLGDARETPRTDGEREVIEAIDELDNDATTKEIAEQLDKDAGQISRVIAGLVERGLLVRGEPEKGRGVPYHVKSIN